MSTVAVIGASGNVGTRLVNELTRRGHKVSAIARHPETITASDAVKPIRGDIEQPQQLATILAGHDVIISTTRFLNTDFEHLVSAVRQSGVRRYLVVGGAGTLYVAPGKQLLDQPDFPDVAKPEAQAGRVFFEQLQKVDDLDWTFISPSAVFAPGERTGQFRVGKDELLTTEQGSHISYEDFAIALVDELEQPTHIKQRFTVGY